MATGRPRCPQGPWYGDMRPHQQDTLEQPDGTCGAASQTLLAEAQVYCFLSHFILATGAVIPISNEETGTQRSPQPEAR